MGRLNEIIGYTVGTIPPAQGGRARQIMGNKRHAQVAAGRFVAAYGAKFAKAAVKVTDDL